MSLAEISVPDEFASSMQKLVAEAAQAGARHSGEGEFGVRSDLASLEKRMTRLEKTMDAGFEKIAAALAEKESNTSVQLERVDGNLRALRSTESVNQRLFDSLHEELRSYRDNFLRDSLQKPFIRDLIVLLDDLTLVAESVPSSSSKGGARTHQWRENLENTIHTLVEILHRLEVNEIEARPTVDRALHRVVSCEDTDEQAEDGVIVKRLKRGFTWRDQLFRPEEVVVKRFR